MIKDKLENIGKYSINENFELFKKRVQEAKSFPEQLETPLKAIPLEYNTQDFDLTKFENHQKNIDVHYIIEGQERIGLNEIEELQPLFSYNEEGDYQHFKGEVKEQIILNKGEFLLLFPGEVHVTGGMVENESSAVEKMVYKVPF